ncbi:hypothetical protein [Spirochaeta isovalerica]|uniref:Ribonuclease HII n=1 Tax=Spirochaeta isovalerica TaxID=150 RepID=A0A841RFX6_9SPIO|nr:hypothetical protein [Spirochaeta isovalerica]MBB6481252.1 ribonuclease HII [Spirochaeta isovalerica]
MFKYFGGIDEAALGPVLGPYCATALSFEIKNTEELFDVFRDFSILQIGDSKKIYTSGKSPAPLEKTALSFFRQFHGSLPSNLSALLKELNVDKSHLHEIREIPWFSNLQDYALPAFCSHEEIEQSASELTLFFKSRSLTPRSLISDVVPAQRFNRYLLSGKNKGETCQAILSPLVHHIFDEKSRITVDRQGGRRYYGEWLMELFPRTALAIRRETVDLSEYDVGDSTIRFQVKGDDKYLETALASIFSKYIREMMMICFNDYWSEKIPGLKRTAGYPQDGKRFIQDLDKAGVSYEKETLIRMK